MALSKIKPAGTIDLDTYDFATDMPAHCYFLVFGMRGSGKSTMMRLASQHMPFAWSYQHIVVVGSLELRKLWGEVVHDFYIHDGSDTTTILQDVINEAQRRIQICAHYGLPFPPEWEIALFIDDCGSYPAFMKSTALRWIASQGRNSHITLFIMVQKLTQAHKECRESSNGVMAMFSPSMSSIKMIHSEFASMVPMQTFLEIYAGGTQNMGMLVVNARPKTMTPRAMFAVSHPDLLHPDGYMGTPAHLGSPDHWAYAEENYKLPEPPKLLTGGALPPIGPAPAKPLAPPPKPARQRRPRAEDGASEDDDPDSGASDNDLADAGAKPPETQHFSENPIPIGNLILRFHIRKSAARPRI